MRQNTEKREAAKTVPITEQRNHMKTVTWSRLTDMKIYTEPEVLEGVLGNGAYLLVAKPKVGKSYLAAQIAGNVSRGKNMWKRKVHGGTVLYLALESTLASLQKRMYNMYQTKNSPRLHFATTAPDIEHGLIEQMQEFVDEYKDTRLIIIDTMQLIKTTSDTYELDYKFINTIKRFANSNELCVLLVHHQKKDGSAEGFDKILGSSGLFGAVDGVLLMEREENDKLKACISLTGRDVDEQELHIYREPGGYIWMAEDSEEVMNKIEPELEAINRLLSDKCRWEGSPTELAEAAGIQLAPNHLTRFLNIHCQKLLEKYHIRYKHIHKHEGRRIQLSRVQKRKKRKAVNDSVSVAE